MNKIIITIVTLMLIAGCGNTSTESDGPVVSVTILPQEYFVKKIAGERVRVNVMIPPGASPATYEPTPVQLASISESDLYLKMGYTGFELAWMDKLTESNASMPVVNLSDGIALIRESSMQEHDHDSHGHNHNHGGIDPHVWMSPKNARTIALNVFKALESSFPENEAFFSENLDLFLSELDSLESWIQQELADLSSRNFFIYHPALSYFSRDYQLKQHPLELGGKEPSPAHMKSLVDLGREKNIGVIFLQMQFDQKNAEILAKEIGAEIIQINPLDPDWDESMEFIVKKIKENLQ